MSKPKVLFFTPTIPDRQRNPFLDPVRVQHDLIERAGHLDSRLIRVVDSRPGDLGKIYDENAQEAIHHGFDWIFAVEDDEAPPHATLRFFLEVQEATHAKILTGTKHLRAASLKKEGMSYPWKWIFFEHGIHRVEPVGMDQHAQPFEIYGGTFATPMLLSVPLLAEKNLHFHAMSDGKNWDYLFSKAVYDAGLPFTVVPSVHAKHYCVDSGIIYE